MGRNQGRNSIGARLLRARQMDDQTADAEPGCPLRLLPQRVPPFHLGPTWLLPNRDITFADTSWYKFKDLSPRIGGTYDLFGDGKTAVKASLGRYMSAFCRSTDGRWVSAGQPCDAKLGRRQSRFRPRLRAPEPAPERRVRNDIRSSLRPGRSEREFRSRVAAGVGRAAVQLGILGRRRAPADSADGRRGRLLPPMVREFQRHGQPCRRRQ